MPSGWNTDWTAVPGEDFTETGAGTISRMFVDAFNERVSVLDPVLAVSPIAYPTVSQHPLSFWRTLQTLVQDIAIHFVRGADGEYDPDGQASIDSCIQTAAGTPIPFPGPNGWQRQFPRTIYTLSQSGTDGQRARFSARIGTAFYEVLSSDGLYGDTVTTPEGERGHSGKYFDRVGGAWVLSADQQSDADLATEENVLIQTGDYFGGHILNDLQLGLNQLTRTLGAHDGPSTTLTTMFGVARSFNTRFNNWYTKYAYDPVTGSVKHPSEAAANGHYDAFTPVLAGGSASHVTTAIRAITVFTEGGTDIFGNPQPNLYEVERQWGKLTNNTVVPNPSGLARAPSWWAYSEITDGWDTLEQQQATLANREYDAFGDDLEEGLWRQQGDEGSPTTDTAVQAAGLTSEEVSATSPRPSPYPTASGYKNRGYRIRFHAIILNFGVEGGFVYRPAE